MRADGRLGADPAAAAQSPAAWAVAEIGPAADKVVYSPTLAAAAPPGRGSNQTDPEAVRHLKAAAEGDLTVGGPPGRPCQHRRAGGRGPPVPLARGGGGKHFLADRARLQLELLDERRVGNGVGWLRYRTQTCAHDSTRSTIEVKAEDFLYTLKTGPAARQRHDGRRQLLSPLGSERPDPR